MEDIIKMIGYCTVGIIIIVVIIKMLDILASIATTPVGLILLLIIGIALLKIGKKMSNN